LANHLDLKLGHVLVREIPLDSIRPHPLNDELYGPVNPSDPDVKALSKSIKQLGVLDELVLTSDLYILSGHRRLTAAKLARLQTVPCKVTDIPSTDERVPALLAHFNRQRVKTADAQVREEMILADPEDAYQSLRRHRQRRADVEDALAGLEVIELAPARKRCKISGAKILFLNAIIGILNTYRKFWPLTDRQIHYYLLNDPPLIHASKPHSIYVNHKDSYKALTELLTRARLAGDIPFHCIHDPTRPVETWRHPQSVAPFVRQEVDYFLKGYRRDLMQSQANHFEIVAEKNTVAGLVKTVAGEYSIPYTIGRGYSSLPPRHAMAERFKKSKKDKLIIIVASDHDPEGDDIPESFARSMRDDFGIDAVVAVKAALTFDQTRGMTLSTDQLTPPKPTSSRHKKFVKKYGADANVYELESVPPDDFQDLLHHAIGSLIDVEAFNAEVDRERQDSVYLEGVRRTVLGTLGGLRGLVCAAEI
jgi:hypothetical protein